MPPTGRGRQACGLARTLATVSTAGGSQHPSTQCKRGRQAPLPASKRYGTTAPGTRGLRAATRSRSHQHRLAGGVCGEGGAHQVLDAFVHGAVAGDRGPVPGGAVEARRCIGKSHQPIKCFHFFNLNEQFKQEPQYRTGHALRVVALHALGRHAQPVKAAQLAGERKGRDVIVFPLVCRVCV